jgi:hypothetical protein
MISPSSLGAFLFPPLLRNAGQGRALGLHMPSAMPYKDGGKPDAE